MVPRTVAAVGVVFWEAHDDSEVGRGGLGGGSDAEVELVRNTRFGGPRWCWWGVYGVRDFLGVVRHGG